MERIMEYKVGDKVRVREDLTTDKMYDGCWITSSMLDFLGKIVTISKIREDIRRYEIEEDYQLWYWTDEMLEPLDGENSADETNVSDDWVLCKDATESHREAVEAPESVDCLLEAKFREAVSKITPEELKEIILKKIKESVDDMSREMFQDILADVLS